MFTVGWPPYCGNEEIREIFSRVGVVEKVYLQHNPGKVEEETEQEIGSIIKRRDFGYIVFKNEEGVSRALSLCSKMVLSCAINSTGLSLWCREYMKAHPCESTLESTAQEGVVSYDMWAEEEKKRKKRLSEPDEEGWITVTKKTPTDPKQNSKRRKHRKQQVLKLYPFQMRETQRKRLAELRRKFAEDQKKIATMKAQRKFKPF